MKWNILSCGIYLLLLLGTCRVSTSSNNPEHDVHGNDQFRNKTLQDETTACNHYKTCNRLQIRAPPTPTPGGSSNGPPPRKRRRYNGMIPSQGPQDIREVADAVGRFQVKHMFLDGRHGKDVNSYNELTGNPVKLRQYLIDVNRRMFKGNVLPATINNRQTFAKWVKDAQTNPKKISLVDGNIADIKNDIGAQSDFQEYLQRVRDGQRPTVDNLFTTREKYLITEIILTMEGDNLKVILERYKAKLKLGMRSEEVYHYDLFDQSEIPVPIDTETTFTFVDVESPSSSARHETTFTLEQLKENEQTTLKFWEEMFRVSSVADVDHSGPLNDQAARFKMLESKYLKDWQNIVTPSTPSDPQATMVANTPGGCTPGGVGRKKRAGNRCAFYIDSEGEIESIRPEQFMEVYESTGEEGRRRMTNLVKNNGDKFIVNDDKNWIAARKRLNQLIHHDEMAVHAELVETTGTIQDWRRWRTPVPSRASQMVTAIHEAVSTRMNKVRLSATKVVYNLAKNPHINTLSKGQKPFGHLMLAKGLITGIVHNDTTALAVIGSRMGFDLVTHVAYDVGTKFFSTASKVGKSARVLGKIAGPIGSIADVGLGAWSLSKSVERLKKADNTYDRDDAIADTVSASVDLTVALATAVISIAFPPFAPLVMAVGLLINIVNSIATALFHAGNAVAKINAQIPLLASEKEYVYTSRLFDFFGARHEDYLEYLVEEKKGNDLMVKSYLDFLKTNKQFQGVVFPSRTLAYDGGCQLKGYYCPFGAWLGRPACTTTTTIGTNCDWNGPCGPYGDLCVYSESNTHIYDCECGGKSSTDFGVAHKDSLVDFRFKRQVYWERAVPGDVDGAQFKCKPSSLEYVDYRLHQSDTREEYYCQHAIGLLRPENEQTDGQSFLVNLEDGDDKVIIGQFDDATPYTFWMGEEGDKQFWGGSSKNDYILNGNCSSGMLSGFLRGGRTSTDSLIITPTCAKGETIRIETHKTFPERSIVQLDGKLNLAFEYFENIIGRPNEAEDVSVVCKVKRVFLNGGVSSKNPDIVNIKPVFCPMNVLTVMNNYTNIVSQLNQGSVTVYVGKDMTGSMINIKQQPVSNSKQNPPQTTVIFTQMKSVDVLVDDFILTSKEASLKLRDNLQREPFTIKVSSPSDSGSRKQYQLFFNESSAITPNLYSVLMIPENQRAAMESPLSFFHNLPFHGAPRYADVKRFGSESIANVFNISARSWDVRGGEKDDTFLLNVPAYQARIDGGKGDDTLVIVTEQVSWIELNENERFKNIETIVKGENIGSIGVSTGCNTKAVVLKSKNPLDYDKVRLKSCVGERDLQIDAGGASKVVVEGDINGDSEVVRVLAHDAGKQPVAFELDSELFKVPSMLVQIQLPRTFPDLSVAEFEKSVNFFRVKLIGAGLGHAIFTLNTNDGEGGPYISSPQIQLLPPPDYSSSTTPSPVQLVFQRDSLEPVIVHVLHNNSAVEERAIGFEEFHNLFQIGGDAKYRQVFGGRTKDTLIGSSTAMSLGIFTGNPESDNTLVIKEDADRSREINAPFQVDLQEGWMGLLMEGWVNRGLLKGEFHHVLGRGNQPDVIVAGCMTKSIAGRGGPGHDHPDLIIIKANEDCKNANIQNDLSSALELHLGPFTKVENLAERGVFKYFVDLTKSADYVSFSLHPNGNTFHKVAFALSPLGNEPRVEFESIKFDKIRKVLTFKAQNHSSSDGVYEFSMYRQDEKSDYSNPSFLLNSPNDNWVVSDVRVNSEGNVVGTSLLGGFCSKESDCPKKDVFGLPLQINNYLINITGDGNGNCGTVHGNTGSIQNNFWLYDLPKDKHVKIEGAKISNTNNVQSNTLHIGGSFHGIKPVTVYLSPESGYVKRGQNTSVGLKWIDNFVGRSDPRSYDTVIPTCYTKQVSGVDLVRIVLDTSEDCTYDLIIGVDPRTRIQFGWINDNDMEKRGNLTHFWNSTFHYRFSEPMSFKVVQSYPGMLDGTVHNFYLPFGLEDLETLHFDEDESKLYYKIDSEQYSISMVTPIRDEDQFYPQPNIVTNDGFKLQIGRDVSLLVTGVFKGDQPEPREFLFKCQEIANALGVTMVIQTDTAFFHVGNNGIKTERNVLQSVSYSKSYLSGGGAADSIYEVVNLNRDVYISSWLENVPPPAAAVNPDGPYISKQTLDLTDIVVPIRLQAGYKYKPKVVQVGDDLIITMDGFQKQYPGKVVLIGGAIRGVRENMQVLLSNAMMEFVPSRIQNYVEPSDMFHGSHVDAWDLHPVDVHLERETVYSVAAEDLEHGHQIIVMDHKYGSEYRFRFNYSRNGDDLHLSDIEEFGNHQYDQRHIEMTTVIVTDFYKSKSLSTGDSDLPTEIRDVTLLLPGLKINLNETNVVLVSNDDNVMDIMQEVLVMDNHSSSINRALRSSNKSATSKSVLLSRGMIPTWKSVLHEVENAILSGLPFVHRIY